MKKNRLSDIEEYVRLNGTVKITELAKHFEISMSTLRRDLDKLADKQVIIKSYGNVMYANVLCNTGAILHSHNIFNAEAKKQIASLAAGSIDNNDIIFIDSGSTCGLIVDYIPAEYHVTIITNNLDVISRSMSKENLDIYTIPGKLNRINNSLTFITDENPYNDYNIGKVFMSCSGIDINYGISHTNINERIVKRYAIERTTNRILLADSSKFGYIAPLRLCDIKELKAICTDKKPKPEYIEYCQNNNIHLFY